MKVLVATDGSESSLKAVNRAIELAEKEGAEITLMAVAYSLGDGIDDMPPGIQDKLVEDAETAIQKAKALFDAKGLKVEKVVESGVVPANNIIRKAAEDKFDLIIMGSTGLTGLERALMGSTSAKVVANAPCSVSVIR